LKQLHLPAGTANEIDRKKLTLSMISLRKAKSIAALALLASTLFSCQNTQQQTDQTEYDLLIQKAMVVDGTGGEPYFASLLISGDSIAKIDKDTAASYIAKRTISNAGLYRYPRPRQPHENPGVSQLSGNGRYNYFPGSGRHQPIL
jgi:hypothetical protein